MKKLFFYIKLLQYETNDGNIISVVNKRRVSY